MPLAPLTRTDSPGVLLSRVSENIARIADRSTQQDVAVYTEILAGLKFEKDFIRQFLREETMQESVIYQDILQKGLERGEAIGQKIEGERLVIRLITRKFGDLEPALLERIKLLSTEELENLGEALLDFSEVTDLIIWLERKNK
ncbi:MAG: DUF4351 domain-containing protein [Chlorogloea purpurea SAG 13.99]|nr:DUF4351 domain-containing protein [Chlorogloea purpurea SAG 13.99]